MDKNTIRHELEQAHMAGQSDAGIDPSYSQAQAYAKERLKPRPQIIINENEGEIFTGTLEEFKSIQCLQGIMTLEDAIDWCQKRDYNISIHWKSPTKVSTPPPPPEPPKTRLKAGFGF